MNIRNLFLVIFLVLPAISSAEIPEQLPEDLSQIPGYVVMAIGEEYLIDLDAKKGIVEGDIFAVVQKGEKVVHPITHEVIGTLDEVKGFLQVTRVKAGYSYARLLQPAQSPINKGDEISRFYQIPARVQAETDDQKAILTEVKKSLPLLNWLTEDSAEEALLVFQQKGNRLVVSEQSGSLLFSYPLAVNVPQGPAVPSKVVGNSPAVAVPVPVPVPSVPVGGLVATQQTSSGTGVWNSPAFSAEAVAMTVSDFDGDGQQEIALILGTELKIVRNVQGQMVELYSQKIATGLTPLALDSIDMDGNGRSEILLTAIRQKNYALSSQMLEFIEGRYQVVTRDVPWFLRVVEYPDEGPVLLGQRIFDEENPFAESLFRVMRKGNRLVQGKFLSLPQYVGIYGFTPFKGDNGQLLYAFLSQTDYLKVVTAAGEILWESSDNYAGSEIRFTMPPEAREEEPLTFYVKKRILVADNNLFVPQNDGLRLLQAFRRFQNSRMVAFEWNGLSLNELWKTADQSGYLNDLALADIDNDGQVELLTFVKFKHKGLFQKGRSALVAYDMN